MIQITITPRPLLFSSFFMLGLSIFLNAQSGGTKLPQHPWFKVKKISEKVWRISDNDIDNIYLVEGRDSAMLIDNGVGAVNLIDFVKSITQLPLIVVNTHSHPDHTGSNHQFSRYGGMLMSLKGSGSSAPKRCAHTYSKPWVRASLHSRTR